MGRPADWGACPWLAWLGCLGLLIAGPGVIWAAPPGDDSARMLNRLWTSAELRGTPSDRLPRRLPKVDRRPPERTQPLVSLPPVPVERRQSIRGVKPFHGRKLLAITFDLCESAQEVSGYDAEIVNVLRTYQVPATFFAGGKWMRSHPEPSLQLMADPLFELGNHGWSHANPALLDSQRLAEQVLWTQAQYELLREELQRRLASAAMDPSVLDAVPRAMTLFRPPYGRCGARTLDALAGWGLTAIQWNMVGADPVPGLSPEALARNVLRQARPGGILVLHANGRGYATAAALPMIIQELRAKGYEMVTVNQLLASGEILSSPECYELKPGDNRRYDRLDGKAHQP